MHSSFHLNIFNEKILSGIRVLDFSRLLPGPMGTASLAAMGAKVIKVESTENKDWVKFYGSAQDTPSLLYSILNNSKKIVSFDVVKEQKKIIALVKKTDILIEQFRPGVMKRWGLDYQTLSLINPGIIYISLTGYGQQTEKSADAGHDINYLAETGLLSLLTDSSGKPVIPGFQLADVAGGSYPLIMACLGALFHKSRKNKGQYIDIAINNSLHPLLALPFALRAKRETGLQDNVLTGGQVNYNVYKTSDERWMALGALEIKFWNNFCGLVNKPEWKREQLEELTIAIFPKKDVEYLFGSSTFNEWCRLANDKNSCLSPVWSVYDKEWFNNNYRI